MTQQTFASLRLLFLQASCSAVSHVTTATQHHMSHHQPTLHHTSHAPRSLTKSTSAAARARAGTKLFSYRGGCKVCRRTTRSSFQAGVTWTIACLCSSRLGQWWQQTTVSVATQAYAHIIRTLHTHHKSWNPNTHNTQLHHCARVTMSLQGARGSRMLFLFNDGVW